MDIEKELHVIGEICSETEFESLDTYEDQIHHYKNMNYTYIPLPDDNKYYNVEEGWLKKLNSEQFVSEDTHLLECLRKLQEYPFILVDYYKSMGLPVNKKKLLKIGFTDEELQNDIEYHEMPDHNTVLMTYNEIQEKAPEEVNDILSIEDSDRFGIVTLADVNRRPVRDMLYKVFSELSSSLSKKIENEYPDSESIFRHLRPVTIGYWWKDQMQNLEIHVSEHMNLLEMMQVIQSSDKEFVNSCGFSSKSEVDNLQSLNNIRNKVMHANRSLIYDRRDIQDILDSVNEAQRIISNLD